EGGLLVQVALGCVAGDHGLDGRVAAPQVGAAQRANAGDFHDGPGRNGLIYATAEPVAQWTAPAGAASQKCNKPARISSTGTPSDQAVATAASTCGRTSAGGSWAMAENSGADRLT